MPCPLVPFICGSLEYAFLDRARSSLITGVMHILLPPAPEPLCGHRGIALTRRSPAMLRCGTPAYYPSSAAINVWRREGIAGMSSAEFSIVHNAPKKTQAPFARPILYACWSYRLEVFSGRSSYFRAERNRSRPARHPEADRTRGHRRGSAGLAGRGTGAGVAFRVLVLRWRTRTGRAGIRRINRRRGHPQIRNAERRRPPAGAHATGSDNTPGRAG